MSGILEGTALQGVLPNKNRQDRFAAVGGRIPGDIGFDPLGIKPTNDADMLEMQNKELNNGRLAILAVAGIVGQEWATGEKLFG